MTSPRTKDRARPRWAPWTIGGAAVVVVAALAATFAFMPAEPVAAPAATSSPSSVSTPTPTPTREPELYAEASFGGWTKNDNSDLNTTFSVNGEYAQEGDVSLRVDRISAGSASYASLGQMLAVRPSTTYSITAWSSSADEREQASPVALILGDDSQKFEFPGGNSEPAQSQWSFTTGPGQTSMQMSIVPSGLVTEFAVDALSVSSDGGATNVVSNASFEDFSSPHRIDNETLVLEAGHTTLDIAWFVRAVDWSVTDTAGTVVASGSQLTDGGIAKLPVTDLPQGYYHLTAQAAGAAIDTAFMILNPAGPGEATSDPRFGIAGHIDQAHNHGSESVAAEIGLTGVRTDAKWNVVETAPGQYVFPADYQVPFAAFEAEGLTVLPLSNGKNKFYDRGRLPHSAAGIQAYADYTAAMVQNFAASAVEVHNELNQKRFNDGDCGITADCYLPLLKATHAAVKAVSPDTLIVGPANANQDDPWLTALYQLGGLDYLDVISYHPYPAAPEALEGDIRQAVSRIKEYNDGQAKPIWLTEFGWTSSTSGAISEQTQANYLVRAETIAFANGVEKAYWYDLVNDETDANDHEGNFGLFRQVSATVPAFEPKPAAMAQAMLIRKLAGKEFLANESLDASIHSYAWGSADESTRVMWSTTPATVKFVSDTPLAVTSGSGSETTVEPVEGMVAVELTEEPLYVEGATSAAQAG